MWTDGIAGEDIEKNEVVTIDNDGMVWRYRTLRKGEKMTTKTCKKSGRKHTPIVSEAQKGMMGAELRRRREGKKGRMERMSEEDLISHLKESAGKKLPKKKGKKKK